jgi:hypothetical protein
MMYLCINFGVLSKQCICLLYAARAGCSVDEWERRAKAASDLVGKCVTSGSRETYGTGWNRWQRHAGSSGFDPFLRVEPVNWSSRGGLSFRQTALIYFIHEAFGRDRLRASTINNYLAGVRHFMNCGGVPTDWFDSFPVRAAKSAVELLDRQLVAIKETRRLPLSAEMIEAYRVCSPVVSDYREACTYAALRLAFTLMLRISEYTVTKADHFLRAEDVSFVRRDGGVVRADGVAGSLPLGDVVAVLVDIRSAKNDRDGEGHRFSLLSDPSVKEGCACSLLLDWAKRGKPRRGQQFFSMNLAGGAHWRLSRGDITEAVKKLAVRFGFNPERFSSHSLRIGGASALAAANVQDYAIQALGRWRSLAFLDYIHVSEAMTSMAQRVMSAHSSKFTVAAIKRSHAGVRLSK